MAATEASLQPGLLEYQRHELVSRLRNRSEYPFQLYPDKSATISILTARRLDRWLVRIHDTQSNHSADIEVLNEDPAFARWFNQAIRFDHTPGKITAFQKWEGNHKTTVRSLGAEQESGVSHLLSSVLRIQIDPANDKKLGFITPIEALGKLRPLLFAQGKSTVVGQPG